jgi:hypothetical protein
VFEKKCDACGAPATVHLNVSGYYCSQHAFDRIMLAEGDQARKLRLRPVK